MQSIDDAIDRELVRLIFLMHPTEYNVISRYAELLANKDIQMLVMISVLLLAWNSALGTQVISAICMLSTSQST